MADFDPNAPATKGDVIALKGDVSAVKSDLSGVKSDLSAVKSDLSAVKGDVSAVKSDLSAVKGDVSALRADMVALEERLTEAFRDGQTELLKAFYGFASTADAKFKDAETSDIALRQRVSVLETRITEVEKRLNFPPAA